MCTFITIAINIVNVGVLTWTGGNRWEGEFKEGKWHGKFTLHWNDGSMYNLLEENGTLKSNKMITDKKNVFYSDSKPVKAIAVDWSKYI